MKTPPKELFIIQKERFNELLQRNEPAVLAKNLAKLSFFLHYLISTSEEDLKLTPEMVYTLEQLHALFTD